MVARVPRPVRRQAAAAQAATTSATPGTARTPKATGPVNIDGAQKGGTVTVLTLTGLTTTIDPSEIYYTDTSWIMSGLVHAFADPVPLRPHEPSRWSWSPTWPPTSVPHNDNYTQWTFTIRPGVKWENGDPVTAKEVAWGMTRCMDAADVPDRPCQYYSNVVLQGRLDLQGSVHAHQSQKYKGDQGQRQQDHHPDGQAVPGHALLGRVPGQRPDPAGQVGFEPEDLQEPPAVDRSVQDPEVQQRPRSSCSSRTRTGTRAPTRPAPSTPTGTTSRASSSRRRSTRS